MKTYNKLVRDNIPKIIETEGLNPQIRILSDKEYEIELRKKLVEEANELYTATSIQEKLYELADVYEVLEFILKTNKITEKDILKIKLNKKNNNGSFEKRVFLKEVN